MTVSDVSTIWFTAGVQEKDLGFVRVGEEPSQPPDTEEDG
jgi:hypothetical protein